MANYINLFEIYGERDIEGLITFLKESDEATLKQLKRQYVKGTKRLKTNEEVIVAILRTMEKALNIGHVFSITENTFSLSNHYK